MHIDARRCGWLVDVQTCITDKLRAYPDHEPLSPSHVHPVVSALQC